MPTTSQTLKLAKQKITKTFSIFQLRFCSIRWCKLENCIILFLLLCATFVVLLCATFQPNFHFYCNMCGITSTHSCISIFAYLLYPILVTCCPALNKSQLIFHFDKTVFKVMERHCWRMPRFF